MSTLESSLLYTTGDGSQDFVHDSYRDFFLAKWIAKSKEHVNSFLSVLINSPEVEISTFLPALSLNRKVSLHYCELVEDPNYLVGRGAEVACNVSDSRHARIRNLLYNVVDNSDNLNRQTIDKFILLALRSAIHTVKYYNPEKEIPKLVELAQKKGIDILWYCERLEDDVATKVFSYLGRHLSNLRPTRMQHIRSALAALKKAIDHQPEEMVNYLYFGDCLMQIGKFEDAITVFKMGKDNCKKCRQDIYDYNLFDRGIELAKSKHYSDGWLFEFFKRGGHEKDD